MRVMIKVTMMLIILIIRAMVTMLEMMIVFVNINSSHISESFIVEDKGLLLAWTDQQKDGDNTTSRGEVLSFKSRRRIQVLDVSVYH